MSEQTHVSITHQAHGKGGRYVAQLEGHEGYLEWEPAAQNGDHATRVATHTVVPRAIGGRGVAAQLVDALVADAREHGFTIDPQCSYVAAKFDQNPDWADLRA